MGAVRLSPFCPGHSYVLPVRGLGEKSVQEKQLENVQYLTINKTTRF